MYSNDLIYLSTLTVFRDAAFLSSTKQNTTTTRLIVKISPGSIQIKHVQGKAGDTHRRTILLTGVPLSRMPQRLTPTVHPLENYVGHYDAQNATLAQPPSVFSCEKEDRFVADRSK